MTYFYIIDKKLLNFDRQTHETTDTNYTMFSINYLTITYNKTPKTLHSAIMILVLYLKPGYRITLIDVELGLYIK